MLHDLPRGASLVDRLEETGAEFLFGVPTHAIDLLAEMRARGARRLGTVRGFRISGAAAPAAVVAELMRHGIMPQSGYGMTETCSHQYTLPDDPPSASSKPAGAPAPVTKSASGARTIPISRLPPGEIGEIGGRGASLMLGYFDDQIGHRGRVQRAGLVHDRRSRLARRSRAICISPAARRTSFPRRAQHLPGADRGFGAALRGD